MFKIRIERGNFIVKKHLKKEDTYEIKTNGSRIVSNSSSVF